MCTKLGQTGLNFLVDLHSGLMLSTSIDFKHYSWQRYLQTTTPCLSYQFSIPFDLVTGQEWLIRDIRWQGFASN